MQMFDACAAVRMALCASMLQTVLPLTACSKTFTPDLLTSRRRFPSILIANLPCRFRLITAWIQHRCNLITKLCGMRWYELTPTKREKKTLFSLQLWQPRFQRHTQDLVSSDVNSTSTLHSAYRAHRQERQLRYTSKALLSQKGTATAAVHRRTLVIRRLIHSFWLRTVSKNAVKQNHSPEAARRPAASVYNVLLVLIRRRHLLLNQRFIGWMVQILLTPSHLAPLYKVTFFEFMEKLYGSWNWSLPSSRQWRFGDHSLHRFWLIYQCDRQTDGRTDGQNCDG